MHQSIPAVPIPPGISGAFFLIVHPEGRALVYPGAFDGFVTFTSQHCHFLSVISSSGKDKVDSQYNWSLKKCRELRPIVDLVWPDLALIWKKVCPKTKKLTYFFTCTVGHLNISFVPAVGHLPVCFQKILIPGARPGEGVATAGNDWCITEFIDQND